MLHNIAFAHQPVINGDVPLQVKLTVMEFDNGETSAADHVDFMHAGDAAFQDHRHEVENLSWSGCGQVDIRQYRVLRPPIVWHAFPWLKKEGISPKASSLSSYMCDIMWPNVRIEPVLWLTWHEPGTPWCVLGLWTGPGHMNGCQTCWQMNQMGESGCLQTTQHMATKVRKTFPSALFPSPICMQDLCTGIYKDHLGKTLQKSPAWVEPASFGHSFHFLPAEIAQQHAASGRSPRGEQRATP